MTKAIRLLLGGISTSIGIFLFYLPGSILFLIAGLMLLSFDIPIARVWLRKCQTSMSVGAKKLDRYLLARKHR